MLHFSFFHPFFSSLDAIRRPVHIDDIGFEGKSVYNGGGNDLVGEDLVPFVEAKVGGNDDGLDTCTEQFANFHLVFMMRLTRFIGFYPNTEDYHDGDYFDLRASCFCRFAPLHSDYLAPEDAMLIQPLMRMNYESMHLFHLSHQQRNRMTEIILRYYQLHVPSFGELQSLDVVRELWE